MTKNVFLLMCAVGVLGANVLMLSPIASAVAVSFPGAGAGDVLGAAAVYGLCTALSALTLAPLNDRFGADRALLVAYAALSLALLASGITPSLGGLVLAQGFAGVASGVALPAIHGLAAHVAPPGRAAQTMGIVLTGWTLSTVAGVSLAALATEIFGWRSVYICLGLLGLGLTGLLASAHLDAPRGRVTSPLTALRVPGVGRALAMMGLLMLAFYGVYTFSGPQITERLGRSTAAAGLLPLLYGLGFGASAWLDHHIDRLGPERAAGSLYGGMIAVYLAIAAAAGEFRALLAMAFVWGVVQHLSLNLTVGRLTALDPAQRGAILGLNSTITYLAVFAGAAGGRPVFETAGFPALALIAAGLLVVVTLEARMKGAWSVPAR